jgi:hypothetical protein
MHIGQLFTRWVVMPTLALMLLGGVLAPRPALASMEDAALFYDELSQHGEWVDYENYGPVWYPTQVQENWRPYVDGRWTPAEEGQVFETQEPWGWATYHYGNWMPTEEYGWVWVPGRTWYPNTVTWRNSPESESPEASYIGWAPIPPPNYTPQPGYYPEGYYGGGPYTGPFENLITAPFWIFVRAANFLLGFAQPYAPTYSYGGCNCLMPPPVAPYYFRRTVIVHNYYAPNYYPVGYIGAGRAYYNYGPPIPYIARVTRIKQVNINNYVRNVNIYQRANVVPPAAVMARRAHFREVLPPAMVRQQPLPRAVHVRDVHMVRGHLARPNLVNAAVIKNAPAIRADLPKTRAAHGEGGQWRRGVPGAALPAGAVMRPDRKMEKTLATIPSAQRLEPVSPRARKWQTPPSVGTGPGQPAAMPRHGGQGPAPEGAKVHGPAAPQALPAGMGPDSRGAGKNAVPGPSGAIQSTKGPQQQQRTPTIEVLRPRHPGSSQAGVKPATSGSGAPPPGSWGKSAPTPQSGMSSIQTPGKGQKQGYPSGAPSTMSGAPARVVPQPQPQPAQPQMQQPQPAARQKKKYSPDQSQGSGSGGPGMTGPPSQSRYAPPSKQPQAQPQPRMQPQPRFQPRPQMKQAPSPQPQAQPQPQPRFQPRPQVQQPQPRFQPRPQVRQAAPPAQRQVQAPSRPQPQPQPKAQPRAQASQPQQQKGKQKPFPQNQ